MGIENRYAYFDNEELQLLIDSISVYETKEGLDHLEKLKLNDLKSFRDISFALDHWILTLKYVKKLGLSYYTTFPE